MAGNAGETAVSPDPSTAPDLGDVAFGTMTFGGQTGEREAAAMVRACLDAGVRTFDTANNYNDGACEEILGRVVRSLHEPVVICTKAGNRIWQDDQVVEGLSPRALHLAVEGSLRRLGVDHIDVFYMHRPDWVTPVEETLEALDELVRSGKVRYLAQSNHTAWQVAQMITAARFRNLARPLVSQPQYNLLSRRAEAEYASCSAHFALTNVVYNPLAGGMLTGKHGPDERPAAGSRFTKPTYQNRYWNEGQFEAVERLRAVAEQAGLTMTELALRWVRWQSLTDCVLLGASALEQLEQNLVAVSGGELDPDTLAACDDVWREIGGVAPPYSR